MKTTFSDSVWQGLIHETDSLLLRPDKVHFTTEAIRIVSICLTVMLRQPAGELRSFLQGMFDSKSIGLGIDGFASWRDSFLQANPDLPVVSPPPPVPVPAPAPVAAGGHRVDGARGSVRDRLGAGRDKAHPYRTPAQGRLRHQHNAKSKQKGANRKWF